MPSYKLKLTPYALEEFGKIGPIDRWDRFNSLFPSTINTEGYVRESFIGFRDNDGLPVIYSDRPPESFTGRHPNIVESAEPI